MCTSLSFGVSIRSEFDGSEGIADTHDGDGLAFQNEGAATCTKGYEVKSRITVPTTHRCHFDDYISTYTGRQFPICVTTTLSHCSGSTIAQNEKLDAPDKTRQSAELALWVALRAPSSHPTTVLECFHLSARTTALFSPLGTFIACLAMRCWSSTNQARNRVSQDCEDILNSTSCRRAWAVGFESANHLDLSGFAIGQSERNSVPLDLVCDKKCCDWATCDLPLWAQECADSTWGDQCKVMCAVSGTESAVSLK